MRLLCCIVTFLALARAEEDEEEVFQPRSYNGTGNNEDHPALGAVGTSQVRAVAGAVYADANFTAFPTAREVMTDVFLASPPPSSSINAVFVAWGQLLLFDLSLTADNSSEPFAIPCDDGGGSVDVWCPLGEASDPIPFFRSEATVTDSVRSPTNHATSYIDLDFVYGRSEEGAKALRSLDGGMMKMTEEGMPLRNDDGTWLIADQRTARFPVTFALHIVLLLEHNRCCVDIAPGLDFEGDENIYQACRGRTIAVFQHVTKSEFMIRLMGTTVADPSGQDNGDDDMHSMHDDMDDGMDDMTEHYNHRGRRRLYDETLDPSADVFTVVAVTAAFESALPSTLRIVGEGYVPAGHDRIELPAAAEDIAGLFESNSVGDILRGAVLSPAMVVGPHYVGAVSNVSPLFKLPVDAVQRGRDHGLPSYNAVRQAYGLQTTTSFAGVSPDDEGVAGLLFTAYGGDIESLDACVGALAEKKEASLGGIFGELLHAAWMEQLWRTLEGDRFQHQHSRKIENVALSSVSSLLNDTLGLGDLPASGFEAPEVMVCTGDCEPVGVAGVSLAERFVMSWEVIDDDAMWISISALGIGDSGMLGIGFGGLSMEDAQDFVICEVFSEGDAECIDRAPTGGRSLPQPDEVGSFLDVSSVTTEAGWTTVKFFRAQATFDAQDYDVFQDIDSEADTDIIYSFKAGAGVGQHPNTNRGSATVNFVTGEVEALCEGETNFVSLHGALMLIAWLLVAPFGLYYVRYRKGDAIQWAGREWYEMHEEIMIVAAEAVLPLGITAVFASRGRSSKAHANWGYYMIAAVAMQIFTGWMRTKGLEAKHPNFSFLHRLNKHFHIWAGRFAYAAGVVQCYRGLELVASQDALILSAGDGLDLQLGSFGWVQKYVFPVWFVFTAGAFLYLEGRKQFRAYFKKGAANLCGIVSIVNDMHGDSLHRIDGKLIPRNMDLPIYSVAAFNDKVLSGQSWVLVDECVLDVSDFAQRHPGGRRLILNALGTDITQELLGKEGSVGHAMSFPPHAHTGTAWRIIRSLVVGYIEEKTSAESAMMEDEDRQEKEEGEEKLDFSAGDPDDAGSNARFRGAAKAVMLNNRLFLGNDNLANKAMRLNDIAAIAAQIPSPARRPSPVAAANSFGNPFGNAPKEIDIPKRGSLKDIGWSSSSSDIFERFQVCPLLFRERMGATSAGGRGKLPSKRPVYRYIFSCPAKAQAQAQAISGVCYFNMRAQEEGKGVVQRAYNAYAVRLLDVEPPTPGGRVTWSNVATDKPRVVPASETVEGVLCIEMRIKMYHDGAMSNLLEKLSKATDNAVVQLQGPFLVEKLTPPPTHRNVVMIAAGTGVNPMVQQIRDYISISRDTTVSAKSRLALVWQSTSESDFFCSNEITALQEKSNGLLEVTALVSGGGPGRTTPGTAFRKARDIARNVFASPAPSYNSAANNASPDSSGGGKLPPYSMSARASQGGLPPPPPYRTPTRRGRSGEAEAKDEQTPTGIGRLIPRKTWRNLARKESPGPSHQGTLDSGRSYRVGDGLVRGKVNRQILEAVFGEHLITSIAAFNTKRATSSLLRDDDDDDDSDEDEKLGQGGDGEPFFGTTDTAGKLQVVVSGPSQFVTDVGQILTEMGVPSGVVVLLD